MLMLKSFLGHLAGTEKSANTIKNYELDLRVLDGYLKNHRIAWDRLDLTALKGFGVFLQTQGYKKNSQRRILLTAQKFLRYAFQRKKISQESAVQVPTPHKVERLPAILDLDVVRASAVSEQGSEATELRNRVLILLLAETGCLVSELACLRFKDLEKRGERYYLVLLTPKRTQEFEISVLLGDAILRLSALARGLDSPICDAHQRFGSMGVAISPRGVEWVLKHLSEKWNIPGLTARALRQSCAVQWLKSGRSEAEVQKLLGLSSDYAFRTYRLLVPGTKSMIATKPTPQRKSREPNEPSKRDKNN